MIAWSHDGGREIGGSHELDANNLKRCRVKLKRLDVGADFIVKGAAPPAGFLIGGAHLQVGAGMIDCHVIS